MTLKHWVKYTLQLFFYLLVLNFYLGPSSAPLDDPKAYIRAFTRDEEFDFVEWTVDAVLVKLGRAPLNTADYLDRETQRQVIYDYLNLIQSIRAAEYRLNLVYTDPSIADPETQAAPIREELDALFQARDEIAPLAESILQDMVSRTVTELGFTRLGQPIPPTLYHATPLPWALIVSPRDRIEQIDNNSLTTSLTVEDHIRIEDQVAESLGYSTLVVPVGGVGTYPTMVAQSTNLNWIASVVAHEWIHNYLTLRPLGLRYQLSPELRTINETTASIAGDEIGAALIAEYFPELVPPPPSPPPPPAEKEVPPPEPQPPAFDFREEMYQTRIEVDVLLAEGKIEEAEAYMESRRQFFWENGYQIRKLNQAYFAFHGAYADHPTSSAGEDPIGAAVRQLRAESLSLIDFIHAVEGVRSVAELEVAVQAASAGE